MCVQTRSRNYMEFLGACDPPTQVLGSSNLLPDQAGTSPRLPFTNSSAEDFGLEGPFKDIIVSEASPSQSRPRSCPWRTDRGSPPRMCT